MSEPSWLKVARKYIGLKEIPGKHHSPTIVRWWGLLKSGIRDDETPWCGAYVGGVLREDGLSVGKGGAAARSWLDAGSVLDKPAFGCIVVFWRGKKSGWSGHVGFLVGVDKRGNLMILGGNQGNMVSIKPFPRERVLGYRWPTGLNPLPERYNLPVLSSDGKLSTNEA